MNVPNMKGKKQTLTYDNESLPITELLRKLEIVGYLEKDGPFTHGSQREKLRKLLREGRISPQLLMEHAAQNPTAPRVQDTRYGTQRWAANPPKKTTKEEVLFRPEPPSKAPRRPVGAITVNGENFTAPQALERFPRLCEHLQQDRRISEKSLQAKFRTWFHSEGNTSPTDFLNFTKNVVIRFLRERPQNNVQMSLICVMMMVDPATGEVTSEKQASFNSKQKSVFESTDLEEMYKRMVTKMMEAFSTYLRNGSGWMLKRVVRLDITLSRLRPLRGSSHIKLPKFIAKRNALINVNNEDEECFKWAVTRALNPVEKNPQRVTKELRKQSEELNWDRIEFPTPCLENNVSSKSLRKTTTSPC